MFALGFMGWTGVDGMNGHDSEAEYAEKLGSSACQEYLFKLALPQDPTQRWTHLNNQNSHDIMESSWGTITLLSPLFILLFIYSVKSPRVSGGYISHIKGPAELSGMLSILGNFWEYYHYGVGVYEFQWQETYGAVYRFKALFNEDRLLVADPKALQYIYQGAGTKWLKPEIRREFGRLFLGRGIAWAQGEDHKRHRKILLPAFGNMETRAMIPSFLENAERLCRHWREDFLAGANSCRVEATDGLSRATLDAVGEVAFKYQFNSLRNGDNRLAKAYQSLLVKTFGLPSKGKIFAQHALGYLPISVFHFLQSLPSRSLAGLKSVAREGDHVAQELIREKLEYLKSGSETRSMDVLDLIVRANLSESVNTKLSEEELSAQMRTIMAAGHETTTNSIAFILYELARNVGVQEKVREEIHAAAGAIRGSDLTASDFERMKYTTAVIKECLRLHPVVYGPFLQAADDDVIPLASPIKTAGGQMISEIPVRKGQVVHISISGYNRLKSLWGETAHQFRPDRWLNPTEDNKDGSSSQFGVYANLGNFVGGAQSCLGWKFAIFEIQAFLIQILRSFKLDYPEDLPRVIRATSGVMAPVLEGQLEKGKHLVLEVTTL